MKDKIKENIRTDYMEMIQNSWTYQRLTQKEKDKWVELLQLTDAYGVLKGTYNQIWQVLGMVYQSYIVGLGYDNFNWRSTKEELENSTF